MKSNYTIRQCQKKEITLILDRFHYLSKNEVKPFGLFQDEGAGASLVQFQERV
jgi:hypothetical protein